MNYGAAAEMKNINCMPGYPCGGMERRPIPLFRAGIRNLRQEEQIRYREDGPTDEQIMACALTDLEREIREKFWETDRRENRKTGRIARILEKLRGI